MCLFYLFIISKQNIYIIYLFEIGFGPLGTSWALSLKILSWRGRGDLLRTVGGTWRALLLERLVAVAAGVLSFLEFTMRSLGTKAEDWSWNVIIKTKKKRVEGEKTGWRWWGNKIGVGRWSITSHARWTTFINWWWWGTRRRWRSGFSYEMIILEINSQLWKLKKRKMRKVKKRKAN